MGAHVLSVCIGSDGCYCNSEPKRCFLRLHLLRYSAEDYVFWCRATVSAVVTYVAAEGDVRNEQSLYMYSEMNVKHKVGRPQTHLDE